jgi:hypothetical protein
MWEKFEFLWTAFEKFALFFSFVATLVILVGVVFIYNALTNLPEPVPPTDLRPLVHAVHGGLKEIEAADLAVNAPISHTVPITLKIHVDRETELKFTEDSKATATGVTIKLKGSAGTLSASSAELEFDTRKPLEVKMDFEEQVAFDVPIQTKVPVKMDLSGIPLDEWIRALEVISATLPHRGAVMPQEAKAGGRP